MPTTFHVEWDADLDERKESALPITTFNVDIELQSAVDGKEVSFQ
jgi:hypothetical protein